jgi:hypothetical protein
VPSLNRYWTLIVVVAGCDNVTRNFMTRAPLSPSSIAASPIETVGPGPKSGVPVTISVVSISGDTRRAPVHEDCCPTAKHVVEHDTP